MSNTITSAKIIGAAGAAWLSGNIAALSLIAMPAAKSGMSEDGLSHEDGVKLWKRNYEAGKAQNPPIALVTASSFAFLAWKSSLSSNILAPGATRAFVTAAICTVGIVPYTLIAMKPTNDKLLDYAAKAKKGLLSVSEHSSIDTLLGKWITLNGIRSVLPLVGAVIAGLL